MKEPIKVFRLIQPLILTLGMISANAAVRTDSDLSVNWTKEKTTLTASVERELRTVGLSATSQFFTGGPPPGLRSIFKENVVKEDLRIWTRNNKTVFAAGKGKDRIQVTLEEIDTTADYIKLKLNGHPIQFKKGIHYTDAIKALIPHLQQMAGDTKPNYGFLLEFFHSLVSYLIPPAHGHPLITFLVVAGPAAFSLITTAIVYWANDLHVEKQKHLKAPVNWNIQ